MPNTTAPRRRRPVLPWALALLAMLSLAACGVEQPPAAAQRTPVSMQLSWVHEYSSAGLYAAEKNGHFANQGLDVRLVEGGFNDTGYIDPIQQVVSGTVDFGLADASSVISARAAGQPVVAIGSILQRSPSAVIALESRGIMRPQDLVGRRVAVADGGAIRQFNALLKDQGIDPATVTVVPRTSFGIEPLTSGQVDAMVGWVINEGIQLQEAGQKPNFLLMSDYGVETYSILIVASERTINERPEIVERFLRSVKQGLEDVVKSPDQAAQFVLEYNPKLDREGQLRRIQTSLPLINPAGSKLVDMQPEVWQVTQQILLNQGGLDKPIALEEAYTLRFLDKLYR